MNTLILLGYGIFESSNTNYKSYLDRALDLVKDTQFEKIVVCGGYTNKNANYSEASSIKNYLVKENDSLLTKIILEEKSITTPQNLQFASELLKQDSLGSTIVICDSIRAPKVYYLTLRYFSKLLSLDVTEEQIYQTLLSQTFEKRIDVTGDMDLVYKNLTVKGFNLYRAPKEIGEQIIATMEEIAAYNYPAIEEDILVYKRKQFEIQKSA